MNIINEYFTLFQFLFINIINRFSKNKIKKKNNQYTIYNKSKKQKQINYLSHKCKHFI